MSNLNLSGSIRQRSQFTLSFFALIFLLLLIRLFNLQIIKKNLYQKKAQKVSEHTVVVPAQRGLIFDRDGELLAGNIELFSLQIIPAEIVNKEKISLVLQKIANILHISENSIKNKVPQSLFYSRNPIELAKDVGFEKIAYFSTKIDDFPGLYWESKPKRHYLLASQLGKTVYHPIGYTGDITPEDLQILYNQGYTANDSIGKSGIEQFSDHLLRGKSGRRFVTVDAIGQRLGENEDAFQMPVNGKNIELTIDMRIQRLVEEVLGARRGSIVVLHAATGEILSMVSYPVFNANEFSLKDSRGFASQALDPDSPFINRAISSEYSPGSTFKLSSAAAILESHKVNIEQRVFCNGSITVGNIVFHCHQHSGHGWQNLEDAITNSCNIYFWTVMRNYVALDEKGNPSIERLIHAAHEFGYGSLTDIDLFSEKPGFIPTREWKAKNYHAPWTGGDTMNMVIGQGFVLSTVLQAANAISVIANEGVIYWPHVTRAVIDPITKKRIETKAQIFRRSSYDNWIWKTLQQYLRSAVLHGTGWMLNTVVPVAGKTGTAETGIIDSYHDWFTAYAPYESSNPQDIIVVAVFLEANNRYEWWSSKLADMIFQGIFANQTYTEVLQTLKPGYMDWRRIIREHEKLIVTDSQPSNNTNIPTKQES